MPTTSTTTTPMGLCQRNETHFVAGLNANATTMTMPREQADERAVAVGALNAEREHEDAEQRAIEERAEAVDDFDQRSEPRRDVRDDAREDAPEAVASFETSR